MAADAPSRRSSGQSTIGGSEAVAGRPSRTAAVCGQIAALHHGVGEMGGADHHHVDRAAHPCFGGVEHGLERVDHAGHHVGGGGAP